MLPSDDQKLSSDVEDDASKSSNVPFLIFMAYLTDQIKNLAARLCILDKKNQKTLISRIQTELELQYTDNLYLILLYLNLKLCNNCFFSPQQQKCTQKKA